MQLISDSPAFSISSMLRRNLWLIRVRWFAIIGFLLGVLTIRFLSIGDGDNVNNLWMILLVLILSNLLFLYRTRLTREFTKIYLVRLMNLQMISDLLILTYLIYVTGGVESPLSFFYVFHIILASIIFPGTLPYIYAALAVLLYSVLLALEYFMIIPHICFFQGSHHFGNTPLVFGTWLIFLTTIFVSAYLAKNVTDRHRRVRLKLEVANQRLQEVNKAKTNFFRVASHEMKAPVATVQSTLMVIQDVLGDKIDARVREMVGRAIGKTSEMIAMLQDLSDLTYGHFQEKSEFTTVDLKIILHEIVEDQRPIADRKQQKLELLTPDSHCRLLGDSTALHKIFLNLVSNAIRYTPEKGEIVIDVNKRGLDWIIEVRDTGPGIPPEEQQNVFQEFYRSPAVRKQVPEGTGLGLSIVQRLVDFHEGKIELFSEKGKGSTFRITLPLGEDL